jgi:hypothetical protein
MPAHQVAFELAGGSLEPGQMVQQTCGEPLCVRPEHLTVGNQADFDRWSPENTERRFWARVAQAGSNDGCWEWQGRRQDGTRYGQTTRFSRPTSAHRLAWILTHGEIPDGLVVCHRCDNPPCCRPDHLFLGTPAENSADMVAKGRSVTRRGLASSSAKLTAEQVREIRSRYVPRKVSTHELAREYGVGAMSIHRIVTRQSYQDIA